MSRIAPIFHIIPGQISEVPFAFESPGDFQAHLRRLNRQRLDLIVKRENQHKSRLLECYYWPVVVELWAGHHGHPSLNAAHRQLLNECGFRDEHGYLITTSDDDFTRWMQVDYVKRCRIWMETEHGVQTPEPGEYAIVEGR